MSIYPTTHLLMKQSYKWYLTSRGSYWTRTGSRLCPLGRIGLILPPSDQLPLLELMLLDSLGGLAFVPFIDFDSLSSKVALTRIQVSDMIHVCGYAKIEKTVVRPSQQPL